MKIATAFLTALMFASLAHVAAQQSGEKNSRPVITLRNEDVLRMVRTKTPPATIVKTISESPCAFDIFPPVLKAMKLRGVSNAVLDAMRAAPYGPPVAVNVGDQSPTPSLAANIVNIPAGTVVEIEAPYTVNSADVEDGSRIPLRVAHRLLVNGVVVIPVDASATARVIKAKGGESWGRAGQLRWGMKEAVAVDGTRVPLRYEEKLMGDDKGSTVATGAATTAAFMGVALPPIAPVAILWGFLKGDDASIPSGKRFRAVVEADTQVRAYLPQPKAKALSDSKSLKKINEQPPAALVRLKIESVLRRW